MSRYTKTKKPRLIETRRHGYLAEVDNPKGKKADISLADGMHGVEAYYAKKPYKLIKNRIKNPDAYMRKAAAAGHKKVRFLD